MKNKLLLKLISIRMKAMLRNFGETLPGKKKSKGILVLFAFLMLYLVVAFEFVFVMLWSSLTVLCTVGLTWLYFGLCGFLATALTVIFNLFATENQLYNASDNELLLAMPIRPGAILLSRIAVLLATALGSTLLTVAPAVGVYIYAFGALTAARLIGILASVLAVALGAQALACILGYLLHLLLRRVKNKAIGTMIFMLLFLGAYFTAYSQVGKFITYLAENGTEVAAFVKTWAAPFYALGLACAGEVFHSLLLIIGAAALFALVYWVLSATFIRSLQGKSAVGRARRSEARKTSYRRRSPVDTVCRKELRKLLTSPIHLTNSGLGCIMLLAAAVAAPFLADTVHSYLAVLPGMEAVLPLLIAAMVAVLGGMSCLTAPSVSLEGKSLWVMRAMPIAGRDVLLGKLKLHVVLTGTASVLAGLSASVSLGCALAEVLLVTAISAEIAVFTGMTGLLYNLLLPNFKWLNEATPCKQGLPVLFSMLTGMGIAVLGGVGWVLLANVLSPALYLGILCVVLLGAVLLLYRAIVTGGARRFEAFEC